MSGDLEVFSIRAPASTAVQQGRGWQITVDDPLPVEPGDIPLEVRRALPGVQFVTRLHLEGDASASIEKKLLTVARGLARSARGVIVDPQRGFAQPSPRPATFDLTKPEDMAAMLSEAAPRYPEVWPFDGPLA